MWVFVAFEFCYMLMGTVSESRRASVDIFLKAAGYLDFAVQHVLPHFPTQLRFALDI